MANTINRVLI